MSVNDPKNDCPKNRLLANSTAGKNDSPKSSVVGKPRWFEKLNGPKTYILVDQKIFVLVQLYMESD